jgi:hypothetical protein
MFPISKLELSFAEISEYWAPELRWSRDMVLALLEGAWWLGEITSNPKVTRLELLKNLFKWMRSSDFSAIVFVTPGSAPPPETIELADRHRALNLRPLVFVPSVDVDTWSEASCIPAFEILAEKPSLQHYTDWSSGFHAMKLNSDEFFRLIALRGLPYPTFWRRGNDDAISLNLKPASEQMIRGAVRRQYDIAETQGKKPPNVKEVAKLVQADLKARGHKASVQKVQKIADSPEFKERRWPPGKTLKSEKGPPPKQGS